MTGSQECAQRFFDITFDFAREEARLPYFRHTHSPSPGSHQFMDPKQAGDPVRELRHRAPATVSWLRLIKDIMGTIQPLSASREVAQRWRPSVRQPGPEKEAAASRSRPARQERSMTGAPSA